MHELDKKSSFNFGIFNVKRIIRAIWKIVSYAQKRIVWRNGKLKLVTCRTESKGTNI